MKNNSGKILMISESPFPEDRRVANEAFALTNAGYKVRFISLNTKPKKMIKEEMNRVTVYRIPQITLFAKSSVSQSSWQVILYHFRSFLGYIFEYVYFTLISFMLSLYIAARHGFDFVHIHNPPNILVLIGLFYKILGKSYIFDHHDLAPELFLSKYNVQDGFFYRLLLLEEILCLKLANLVIATNESYKRIDIKRGGIKKEKVSIVRNGPDLTTFKPVPPDRQLRSMGKTILAYLGVMGVQDGVDYMLRSLKYLAYALDRKDFFCIIIGPGDAVQDLKELTRKLELENYVRFTGFIPKNDLLRYLSTADICLDPNPSNPLNDFSTWIKVMEYMAMGKPVISFDLKETRYTAQGAAIYVPLNDERKYAEAIADLMDDPRRREKMGVFGRKRIHDELAWHHVSKNLITAYQTVLSS